jgi:hypothetical protein
LHTNLLKGTLVIGLPWKKSWKFVEKYSSEFHRSTPIPPCYKRSRLFFKNLTCSLQCWESRNQSILKLNPIQSNPMIKTSTRIFIVSFRNKMYHMMM